MWNAERISWLLRLKPDLTDPVLAKRLTYYRGGDGTLHASLDCDWLKGRKPRPADLGVADLVKYTFCRFCGVDPPDDELAAWSRGAEKLMQLQEDLERFGAGEALPSAPLEEVFLSHCRATWDLNAPPTELASEVEQALQRSWDLLELLRSVRGRRGEPRRQEALDWLSALGQKQFDPHPRLWTVELREDRSPHIHVLLSAVPVPPARGVLAFVAHPNVKIAEAVEHGPSKDMEPAVLREAVRFWHPGAPDSRARFSG